MWNTYSVFYNLYYSDNYFTEFISYFNKLSETKDAAGIAGAGKNLGYNIKEVFLRRRILFFCNLKRAVARENALLQLKPIKPAIECREFE